MDTQTNKKNLIEKLKETLEDETGDYKIRSDALYAYADAGDPEAFDYLSGLIDHSNHDVYFKGSIIWVLSELKTDPVQLDDYLLKLTENPDHRTSALQALARRGVKDAIPIIVDGILNAPDQFTRSSLASSFSADYYLSWKERFDYLINEIEKQQLRPAALDEEAFVTAIVDGGSTLTGNKDHIIEELILRSVGQDRRMTGVYAKLIVELSSKSQSIAGQKINEVEADHNIDPDQLKSLRIAIGGDTAIDSVMGILQTNLDKYFQNPIHELNTDTHRNWKKTIQYAQYGFMTRMIMSVVVFIIGIMLLGVSSYEFLFGNATGDQLFGVGVSFVAGLGTMLTVVYTGPLRQIRESVNDLGIASAAFIAYIHRVLEISHTFSYYYLNQKITFEEMTKSSELIDEAMKNTIKELSDKSAKM